MATYKVIQDVEAEDKIIGPLSLKQLIFAIISAGFIFIAFRLATLAGSIFLAIPFLPFIILFGALAAPLSKTQPTDVWLAAQFRFFTKPKARLWNQNGLKQLVKITVPPKLQKNYTDGLSQGEVKSRLSALANTLDSRGWAVKNVETSTLNYYQTYGNQNSDRLMGSTDIANTEQDEPIGADVLAESSTETQQLNGLISQEETQRKQQLKIMMQQASAANIGTTVPVNPVYDINAQNVPILQASTALSPTNQTLITNTLPQITQSPARGNAQPSPEETEIIRNIIKQKKAQQDALQANPHHRTIQTPQQIANNKPIVAPSQPTDTKTQKEDNTQLKPQEIHSNKTTAPKTGNIDNANALEVSPRQELKQHNKKPQQDEVIIQLH